MMITLDVSDVLALQALLRRAEPPLDKPMADLMYTPLEIVRVVHRRTKGDVIELAVEVDFDLLRQDETARE